MLYLGDDRPRLLGHHDVAVVRRVEAPVDWGRHRDHVRHDGRGGAVERRDNLVTGQPVAVGDRPHCAEENRGRHGRVAMKAGDCADKVDIDVDKAGHIATDV